MPFFDSVSPAQVVAARPYRIGVDAPWQMVSANAFDVQHFKGAHDRRLLAPARVDVPAPFARRITVEFGVAGDTWRDRLTRIVSGDRLTMSITVWGGLLMFVEAKFRRTTTYGLLCLLPTGLRRTEAVNIIFVERGGGAARAILDPVSAHVRRNFIRNFLSADVRLLSGLRYSPATLLDEDRVMLDYLAWLQSGAAADETLRSSRQKEESCERCS
jgi:hypothetical protein